MSKQVSMCYNGGLLNFISVEVQVIGQVNETVPERDGRASIP